MIEERDYLDAMTLEERIARAERMQRPMSFEELIAPEIDAFGMIEELIWDNEINGLIAKRSQDCTGIVENNKEQQNATRRDWRKKDDKWHWFASIPNIIIEQWQKEDGFFVYAGKCDRNGVPNDPMRRILQKLRDPDWRWLRTTDIDMGDGKHSGMTRLAHVPGNGIIWGKDK